MIHHCPLCAYDQAQTRINAAGRDYLKCARCALIWLTAEQHPSLAEERAEYALHENNPADQGYRRHLARLTDPLLARLPEAARQGLDFGSGPGPAISVMLGEQDYDITNYDPAFAPDAAAVNRRYDFITCTETAEHFHQPSREFDLLTRLIKPGGLIGIMTSLRTDAIEFADWYYIRERSHVTFYAPDTFRWIARKYGWLVEIIEPNVVILRC